MTVMISSFMNRGVWRGSSRDVWMRRRERGGPTSNGMGSCLNEPFAHPSLLPHNLVSHDRLAEDPAPADPVVDPPHRRATQWFGSAVVGAATLGYGAVQCDAVSHFSRVGGKLLVQAWVWVVICW